MSESLALALGAGALAAVNPCGFALLPAYFSFLIIGDQPTSRPAAVGRALLMTAAMTSGFVAVFGAFGLVVAPVAPQVERHLPWVTMVIGLVLLGLGAWLLAGRDIPAFLPKPKGRAPTRSFGSMAVFGASYALASLSCTVAPFVFLVAAAFQSGSVINGIGLFLAYAVGMGIVVGSVALLVALARASLLTHVKRALPYVMRVGGLLLVIAGAYVAYYGWYEVRVLRGGAADDPVIGVGNTVQAWMSGVLEQVGATTLAVVFVVLLAIGAAAYLRTRSASRVQE